MKKALPTFVMKVGKAFFVRDKQHLVVDHSYTLLYTVYLKGVNHEYNY